MFALIQSLTKAEKRNFSLYVRRIQIDGDVRFFQLFEILEKQAALDEEAARKKLDESSKSQFSNLKRHLYQHLLTSLRLMYVHKELDIQIRELIDYAHILYGRGLYLQALKILNRVKTIAKNSNQDILHLEIVEFEKRIESRHITRSDTARIEGLQQEADRRTRINSRIVHFSNLKLQLQRLFINEGHATTEAQRQCISEQYAPAFDAAAGEDLTFFERVYFYQSKYWYHFILLEMEDCHLNARAWANLYSEIPLMISEDVDVYMIALHHVLSSSFYMRDHATFDAALAELEAFRERNYKQFSPNSQIFSFLYMHQGRYNQCFMRGDFERAVNTVVPRTLTRIRRYGPRLDPHKVHIFYYKIAWAYLGNGQPGKAIDYLNKIINDSGESLREDIQIYTRLMFIMVHYELGHRELVTSLILSADRFLKQVEDPHPVPRAAVRFFGQVIRLDAYQAKRCFIDFAAELQSMQPHLRYRRAFMFLDLVAWLRAKIEQRPLGEVVREGYEAGH